MELISSTQTIGLRLLLQLADFGLNPQDWNLSPLSRDCYRIENKSDQNFTFLGLVDRGSRSWKRLCLISL